MRTELPAARLHRRLGAARGDASDVDSSADGAGDDEKALLARWLPDGSVPAGSRNWLAAVRADPGRAGAIALAVVGALAVLVTVFTLIRDDPAPVVSAKLPPVEMVSSASARPSGTTTSVPPDQPVVVSVVGLVTTPGLVTLAPNARVADAVSAAGGVLDGADTIGLNLARHLADGEQVVVGLAPTPGEPAALGSSVTTGKAAAPTPGLVAPLTGTATPGQPIDLNSATVEQLETLPGIGPVTAAAIVAWRDTNGSFTSVEQLGDVDGIGPARLDKLRDLVRV